MSLTLYTFGFKYPDWRKKVPITCTLEDVRERINDPPPKIKGRKLHSLSGNDRCVRELILENNKVAKYLDEVEARLATQHTHYAFGCTSGRHRSVSVAVEMKERLKKKGITVTVVNLYL